MLSQFHKLFLYVLRQLRFQKTGPNYFCESDGIMKYFVFFEIKKNGKLLGISMINYLVFSRSNF